MASLVPAGPELLKARALRAPDFLFAINAEHAAQGVLTLSFFERRISRALFGLVSNEEKVRPPLCLGDSGGDARAE